MRVIRKFTVGSLMHPQPVSSIPAIDATAPIKQHSTAPYSTASSATSQIKVAQHQQEFTIQPVKNQFLLDTALEQNQSLQYKCRKGTCGACTIQVLDGSSLLSEPSIKEQHLLKEKLKQQYRLACQAFIL